MNNRLKQLLRRVDRTAFRYLDAEGSLEREDFAQEIWLAMCEGRMSEEDLHQPGSIKALIKDCPHLKLRTRQKHYVAHQLGEHATDDLQTQIIVASKEWTRKELSQRHRFFDAYDRIVLPTQIDDVFERQLREGAEDYPGFTYDEIADELEGAAA